MNLLALDASGPSAGVAIFTEGRVAYRAAVQNGNAHACELLPLAEEGLRTLSLPVETIDYVACVVGPGSFTGVRIGVASAIGFAQPRGIPCIPVDALEALAASLPPRGLVVPLLDARAGQVYAAAFLDGERLLEDRAEKLADFLGRLPPGMPAAFLGDACGSAALVGQMRDLRGGGDWIAPPHLCAIDPAAAAVLAASRLDAAVPPGRLEPMYLRQPQAERERAARLRQKAADAPPPV